MSSPQNSKAPKDIGYNFLSIFLINIGPVVQPLVSYKFLTHFPKHSIFLKKTLRSLKRFPITLILPPPHSSSIASKFEDNPKIPIKGRETK